MRNYAFLWLLLLAGAFIACNPARKQAEAIQIEFGKKPTIVYKTKKDYSSYVPVLLSADKSQIVGYPGPKDLYYNDKLAYPTALKEGYWLDNRGINKQVAFLDMTYSEYASLEKAPGLQMLMERIQDKDPLVACYDCGSITEINRLNILIEGKALSKCKNLME